MYDQARIFTLSREVARTIAAVPGMAGRVHRFDEVPGGIDVPPGGLYVARIVEDDWGVPADLVPYLSYPTAHRRFRWLHTVWPTLAWRTLVHRARAPVVYHHHLERGDSLYYAFGLFNGALKVQHTSLVADRNESYGLDGHYVQADVWAHLGMTSTLGWFPPNDGRAEDWPAM